MHRNTPTKTFTHWLFTIFLTTRINLIIIYKLVCRLETNKCLSFIFILSLFIFFLKIGGVVVIIKLIIIYNQTIIIWLHIIDSIRFSHCISPDLLLVLACYCMVRLLSCLKLWCDDVWWSVWLAGINFLPILTWYPGHSTDCGLLTIL